jgi:hypothetical protein
MGSAFAEANIQIGPGTGSDPVQLTYSNYVGVLENSGKQSLVLNNPWYLILGIPLGPQSQPPTPSNSWITSVNGNTNAAGWSYNSSLTGSLTFNSTGSAYEALGLDKIDGSESWTNWATAEKNINGFTPASGLGVPPNANLTSFDLVVFNINSTLAEKQTTTVQFSSGLLPFGTFVLAYGTGNDGKSYGSAFTNTGLTTDASVPFTPNVGVAPAPSSVVLLGLGGVGFALILVRSRRRMVAAI